MFKKVEHYWKSLIHDGDSVSVHRPGFYARRFQDFMKEKVFKRQASPGVHGGGGGGGGGVSGSGGGGGVTSTSQVNNKILYLLFPPRVMSFRGLKKQTGMSYKPLWP